MNENENQLRFVAYVFNIIATVILAISLLGILTLCWTIPMTIHSKKIITSSKSHVAFGVCCLFFVNPVSGILILCSGGEQSQGNIKDANIALD